MTWARIDRKSAERQGFKNRHEFGILRYNTSHTSPLCIQGVFAQSVNLNKQRSSCIVQKLLILFVYRKFYYYDTYAKFETKLRKHFNTLLAINIVVHFNIETWNTLLFTKFILNKVFCCSVTCEINI